MKKAVISVMGALAIASLVVLMSSCTKSCTCTFQDSEGDKWIETEFPENYNAKNCKDLGSMLSGDGLLAKCK